MLAALLVLGACATRGGHYYADDGPPEHVPADLGSLPDAVPRLEPVNPYANRPYSALGHSYTPDTSDSPFEQRGIASWYGRQFHGNRTASGEPYDMFAMTAAHPTLPIPSYARVTRVADGRSVIVRINDRGPFLRDRVIDLSYAAATRLGIAGPGSGEVIVHKLTAREISGGPAALAAPVLASAARPVAAPASVGGSALANPVPGSLAMSAGAPLAPMAGAPVPAPALVTTDSGAMMAGAAMAGSGVKIWSVQLGAFGVAANAVALRERLALLLAAPDAQNLPPGARLPRVEQDGHYSRVLIGALGDRAAALAWAQQLQRYLGREATVYAR